MKSLTCQYTMARTENVIIETRHGGKATTASVRNIKCDVSVLRAAPFASRIHARRHYSGINASAKIYFNLSPVLISF